MARPRKPRFFDGVQLESNLYPDTKKRLGKWRIVLTSGESRTFDAQTTTEANAIAKEIGEQEKLTPTSKHKDSGKMLTKLGILVEDFIIYREQNSPELSKAASWKTRTYALRQFGRDIETAPSQLRRGQLLRWWDSLTYNQQKLRHAEFRRLFNYLMGRDLFAKLEYNPFTTADDKPRFYVKDKPARARLRLKLSEFWAIYHSAGDLGHEGLQIAMAISLLTFLREGDILQLRIDQHLEGDILKLVIGKSAAQKGHTEATRLQWSAQSHTMLKSTILRGKELSMKNMRCPFLISHIPRKRNRKYTNQKEHIGQMPKERFTEQFREARDATGLWANIPNGKTAPTFHEIRSLADATAKGAGHTIKDIQEAMAHSDDSQTKLYLADHELPYTNVNIVFTEEMIGGEF